LSNVEPSLTARFADKTKTKMKVILQIALDRGHDSVVLGAFGCGAFRNPPATIAQLFREVIFQDYKDCFCHITFAILEDQNSGKQHNPQGNLPPFVERFKYVK